MAVIWRGDEMEVPAPRDDPDLGENSPSDWTTSAKRTSPRPYDRSHEVDESIFTYSYVSYVLDKVEVGEVVGRTRPPERVRPLDQCKWRCCCVD